MRFTKSVNATPIPGYRLLSPLGAGGFGEVWKCEAPGGLFKAVKFVYGNRHGLDVAGVAADEELQAIQRIKAIRHPFLLSMDRVEVIDGDLVIVMELADRSLHDLLVACREAGRPGIPRDELLGYLREAAEVLDLMNLEYGLQHLDVKPRNLFLVSNHVKVADFGLVNRLGGPGDAPALQLGAVTPLYAAPEAFTGALSRQCDQYSLAVVYQELLTGTLPYRGQNVRQLLLQHTQGEPDLAPLPEADRPVIARALAKDPARRFPSCTDLVRALAEAGQGAPPGAAVPPGGSGVRAALRETPCQAGETTPRPVPADADLAATEPLTRGAAPRPPAEDVPGYHLLSRLRSTPVAEVWKAQAADGRPRLVQVIFGFARPGGNEAEAVARLAALQHPALLPREVVQHTPGRLVLAADLVPTTLADRAAQCRAAGEPGVPPEELLGYLATAAETLDYYAGQHGVYHLGLNPRALLLDGGRLLLADLGLAHLLWAPAGQPVGKLNARHAAPEVFDGRFDARSDQYSLAVIYHELRTGAPPRRGAAARGREAPDLTALLPGEREVIARALRNDPGQRWPSCVELVRQLEAAARGGAGPDADASRPVRPASLRQVLTELLAAAAVQLQLARPAEAAPAADGEGLRHRFRSRRTPEALRDRLEQLRQQWNGQLTADAEGVYAFQVLRALSFWQRCIGRPAGLEVQLQLLPPDGEPDTTPVALHVRPFGCRAEQGAQLLKAVGPLLLESTATCLEATAERRGQERLPWPHALRVRFMLPGRRLGDPVPCRALDISLTGIGFCVPPDLPTRQVVIDLEAPFAPPLTVPARIVRTRPAADGWCEVGAAFS